MRNPVNPMEMPNNLGIANILTIKAPKSLKKTIEIIEHQTIFLSVCALVFRFRKHPCTFRIPD